LTDSLYQDKLIINNKPMFLPGVRELVKPQWVAVLEELKQRGGMSVPALAEVIGMSYMGIKQHCLKLAELGYLESWRVPRVKVGRPEIMYRLTRKADGLFPYAGLEVSVGLLEAAARLFGPTAPAKLLQQLLMAQRDEWLPKLSRAESLVERATKLADMRARAGCLSRCRYDADRGFRIEEFHHPLRPIFERWPAAQAMELRMMQEMLGSRVERREVAGGRAGPARVDYEVVTLGTR
jgi:predicted ArsR family transcriptional regulator